MTKIQIIIPFRLRPDADIRRLANLDVVQAWWFAHGFEPQIVSDGLEDDAQFNRHRAYNDAVSRNSEADVFVFTEADMLIHPDQIDLATRLALRRPGLVVPFTQYRYLDDTRTAWLRDKYHDETPEWNAEFWSTPVEGPMGIFHLQPESVMNDGKSIGAVNVVSRETLAITGGFTEATSGNWYDDNIIEEGFAFLTGNRTAFVPGPAVHLYHLPGHKGDHLSDADRAATERNHLLLRQMRRDIRKRRTFEVKRLMSHREW